MREIAHRVRVCVRQRGLERRPRARAIPEKRPQPADVQLRGGEMWIDGERALVGVDGALRDFVEALPLARTVRQTAALAGERPPRLDPHLDERAANEVQV